MQQSVPPHAYSPARSDPAALAALRTALSADPAALDRVADLADREEALAAMIEFAAGQGIALEQESLHHTLRADPLGIERLANRPVTALRRPGPRWLPIGLGSDGAQLVIDWGHFGQAPMRDPFFEGAQRRARGHPVSVLVDCRTPLGALLDEPELSPPPRLDGLVFHMSRCGSTLVSRALRAMSGNLVLSEPPPFDELLQQCAAREDIPLDTRLALLRAMAGALASDRDGTVQRRFLKTDCWHAGALPLLRAAFPDTPWIFLYRDPVEVLMSHERMSGSQTLPGPQAALVGIDPQGAYPGLEFATQVLSATCHRAADHAGIGGGIYVDFATLPAALEQRILPHFGIAPDEADRQAIAASLTRDAKQPNKAFDPHERPPRSEASAAVLELSERLLAPAVARLRALDRANAD